MIFSLFLIILISLVILGAAFLIGKRSFAEALTDNDREARKIVEFKACLIAYANSNGEDQESLRELLLNSASVEIALGWDNIVTGVNIGRYQMNGAPLLPLAIHEMSSQYSDRYRFLNNGGQIAHTIQAVIFRHLGRRLKRQERLESEISRAGTCIVEGLRVLAGIPISILLAFGILSSSRADAARSSWLFRLWTFIVSLAAIGGPALAYLADRAEIDAAIRALLAWS